MKNVFKLVVISALGLLVLSGCKEEPKIPVETEQKLSVNSCEGCHTNYTHLKKVYSPDTVTAGGGCGGDIPHIEPYDRVYLGGDGYKEFKASTHGKIPCTSCHNGVDNTSDKKLAHSGDFIKHPSDRAEEKCAGCHSSIVLKAKNNIHHGWGQKSMLILRYGLTYSKADEIPSKFEMLPTLLKEGYKTNCSKCHASCGDCHINRPTAGGGGLLNGHKFSKPDMIEQCTKCHSSRGAHAFFGVAPGTSPDVHQTKGMTCLSCHKSDELHGDGNYYDQRYKVKSMPKCENCHKNINTSNMYHAVHINTFNCNVCHSQDYNNCGSCHVGGEGARIPSYQSFKIGINPIPDTKPYKYATLRRSLMAPDSWKEYGVSSLPNFAVRPTYKYATPHNILRWTSRTKVQSGKPCYDNCHIIKEGNTVRNKQLYLFESDLLDWEKPASRSVVVDGKLPSSWNY
ncbi:MAG: hypothetical protein N3F03_07745 [Ignavibacteria bacterium]|nr:hypothetical protein [Ignavibacteria bacterium]